MLDKSAFVSRLQECFPVDSTVYVITTSVARTGMSRRMRVLCVRGGEIHDVTGAVCAAGLYSGDIDRGALVRGCGMDMHWAVAESIMRAVGHRLRKVSL